MKSTDICKDCSYSKGYIELGICPVCGAKTLKGKVETRELFCSNGCEDFPFSVSFLPQRNCLNAIYKKNHHVFVNQKLSFDVLKKMKETLNINTVEIYNRLKNGQPIVTLSYLPDIWRLEAFLKTQNITYLIIPSLPYTSQKEKCFPF